MFDGKKIEELRSLKGKNQTDTAKAIGLTQSAYSVREKTGNFEDDQILKLCRFLGIKKEQIELNDLKVNELTFITNKLIQTESALKIILSAQAEIIAKLTNGNATKIRTDLESAVDSLSKQALEQLQRQV